MALRFMVLFIAGLLVGAALVYSDNEEDPRAPITRKPALWPKGEWPYENYTGFCYIENSLGDSEYTRGDLFLWGRPSGKRVEVRGALYKLRGPAGENVIIEIQGGQGFQDIRSLPLQRSKSWQRVPWRSRLPRFVEKGSSGEFSFNFQDTLLDKSCAWNFSF